jgi:hypothetical protein
MTSEPAANPFSLNFSHTGISTTVTIMVCSIALRS